MFIHSFINLSLHSFIHSFIHLSRIHSFIHSFMNLSINSSIHRSCVFLSLAPLSNPLTGQYTVLSNSTLSHLDIRVDTTSGKIYAAHRGVTIPGRRRPLTSAELEELHLIQSSATPEGHFYLQPQAYVVGFKTKQKKLSYYIFFLFTKTFSFYLQKKVFIFRTYAEWRAQFFVKDSRQK